MKFKTLLYILISIALFSSCKKNPAADNTTQPPTPIPAATSVNGSVSGIVVDENNDPVPYAQVTVSGTAYTTDSKGFFNTTNLTLDKYISTATVNKPGYFKAIRSFAANPTKNYVSIKLIPKTLIGSFTGSAANTVSLSNSSQISFLANSVNLKSSGVAYMGTVNVYSSYIDPISSDIGAKVPGNFIGEDASNIYYLQSAGMIAVELESATGESLQLASGKSASLKLAIPAILQSKAPATIDTWSLDDRGIWKKEGTATKNGTYYDMQVSHFSFWNCDRPANTIYLTLNIKDQNNHILANTGVQLTATGNASWGTSYGLTDSLGNVSGLVPANEALQMTLLSSFTCSNPLYTQTIGPFAANADVNVIATVNLQQVLTITARVNNCSGAPVTNGTAIIVLSAESRGFYTNVLNGNFSINITHCSALPFAIQVTAIDNTTQQQSSAITITATQNIVDAGIINGCGISTADSSFIDSRDGQVYTFKRIGAQVWMTQNLNYAAAGAWCQGNNSANCAIYGQLYDWNTALTVAPPGWHLPSDAEWTTLITYLGGESLAGGAMKATTLWDSPNTGATNTSGFTGLPGGYRFFFGAFSVIGGSGNWWSSTESSDTSKALFRLMYYNSGGVGRIGEDKTWGFSIRCLRD
jgi:uncharacterized protein (TIGR02145 family)